MPKFEILVFWFQKSSAYGPRAPQQNSKNSSSNFELQRLNASGPGDGGDNEDLYLAPDNTYILCCGKPIKKTRLAIYIGLFVAMIVL